MSTGLFGNATLRCFAGIWISSLSFKMVLTLTLQHLNQNFEAASSQIHMDFDYP